MAYYAITSETGLQWTGYAGNATEAVRIHMADIGVDSYREPIVLEIPEPPEGWEDAGPTGWLSDWVDEHGRIVRVASQVRVNGHVFGWDAVGNLMDPEILEEMDAAGIRAEPLTAGDRKALSLDEFVAAYRERHAAKYGEPFVVN